MTSNRFAPGTFTPDPRPATVQKMLAAQFGLELKLLLRNGEQLLLTMFIPITLLVGLTLLPFGNFGDDRAQRQSDDVGAPAERNPDGAQDDRLQEHDGQHGQRLAGDDAPHR